jgi:hypothetical protein
MALKAKIQKTFFLFVKIKNKHNYTKRYLPRKHIERAKLEIRDNCIPWNPARSCLARA